MSFGLPFCLSYLWHFEKLNVALFLSLYILSIFVMLYRMKMTKNDKQWQFLMENHQEVHNFGISKISKKMTEITMLGEKCFFEKPTRWRIKE